MTMSTWRDGVTNVAADKHFWTARCARIVRCACS
jgi:hypothetical protein